MDARSRSGLRGSRSLVSTKSLASGTRPCRCTSTRTTLPRTTLVARAARTAPTTTAPCTARGPTTMLAARAARTAPTTTAPCTVRGPTTKLVARVAARARSTTSMIPRGTTTTTTAPPKDVKMPRGARGKTRRDIPATNGLTPIATKQSALATRRKVTKSFCACARFLAACASPNPRTARTELHMAHASLMAQSTTVRCTPTMPEDGDSRRVRRRSQPGKRKTTTTKACFTSRLRSTRTRRPVASIFTTLSQASA